jgi:nucleoside-diphosphate-sugar epimerase
MLADGFIINLSLGVAFLLRLLWYLRFELTHPLDSAGVRSLSGLYFDAFKGVWWILTITALVVFQCLGVYTKGRFYQSHFKFAVIAQGVSISYLLVGFGSYFVKGSQPGPRGAFLAAWAITLSSMILARIWANLWGTVHPSETRLQVLDSPRIKNIAVIGGAGYIGSALLPKLLENGYNVKVVDLLVYGTDAIQPVLDHPRLQLTKADFRQVDAVVSAVRDVDVVVHLGGLVGDPACALDEALTIDINLSATRMIGEVAKGSGVRRFIFASTCSVYGASDEILDEYSALNPVSLYARSKIASEKVLMAMAGPAFCPTILRFGTIYGLSGRTRFDLVVNLLTAKAVAEGMITVFGGDQWRPFLHVDDAALAVVNTIEAPAEVVRHEIFNVGSNGQNYTLSQVGEAIKRFVPAATLVDMGMDGDRRNYRVDFAKISRHLGFMPIWTLEGGIAQVIEAIANGSVKDYRDARYSNVKFLNETNGMDVMRRNNWERDLINDVGPVLTGPGPLIPISKATAN